MRAGTQTQTIAAGCRTRNLPMPEREWYFPGSKRRRGRAIERRIVGTFIASTISSPTSPAHPVGGLGLSHGCGAVCNQYQRSRRRASTRTIRYAAFVPRIPSMAGAQNVRDIAWKAQVRLLLPVGSRRSSLRRQSIAREMAGFIWAIARQVQPRVV
jgi:hypothetical protein